MRPWFIGSAVLLLFASGLHATIFGGVRGTVRDRNGAPLAAAQVTLRDIASSQTQLTNTDSQGAFRFGAVPIGTYRVAAAAKHVTSAEVTINVVSGTMTNVTLIAIPATAESITVTAPKPAVDVRSATTQTTITRGDIAATPGAQRSNSVAMITQFVPGSYVVHDQLHVRGGHQVDWLIDGVPVPNTNIASNVGPQFDPKDVDVLEIQRGGYSAEYGDRTYAVFNVVPKTGWDRNREAALVASYGSQRTTDDQFSIGDHNERSAYYASVNGNRTDHGLETPVARAIHDAANGFGALATLVVLPTNADQLRFVGSWRRDEYQIPNDEELAALNVDDHQREHDAFITFSWVHVLSKSALLTVSPFVHENNADFEGGADDPLAATDRRDSRYGGAQATLAGTFGRNDARVGGFGFAQRDNVEFGLRSNDIALSQADHLHGNLAAVFAEDAFDVASWLTLRGGLRLTRFSGGLTETVVSPRFGATARLPWQGIVVRASAGRYYQAPPLSTISGPLLQFALDQGFGFLPLRGERDLQEEVGALVPVGGWNVDAAAFRTEARNFFDHDVLGNSNIFLPLTIDRVHIRGIETTVRSPMIAGAAQFHLAYSHQKIEGEGAVAGGLTDFKPPQSGRFLLDHDQRDTLTAGLRFALPRAAWIAANVNYGSGFLQGDGPAHLRPHATFDIGASTAVKMYTLTLSATNVTNKRYLLDESNTFGGTHVEDPRQVSLQLRYRFQY
jgi:outer membrane cobalamin receptor